MEEKIKKMFANLKTMSPPLYLYESIINRIEQERQRVFKMRFIISGTALLFSLVAIFYGMELTARGLSQSGFYQYLSLIFTDINAVVPFWKEFLIALVESSPIFGATVILISLFSLLGSIKSLSTILMPR